MRVTTTLSLTFLLLVFFTSCEKYLDFDEAAKESKIVLNSSINPDSTFVVHLSRSLSVLDNGDLTAIENGEVTVYTEDGNVVETLVHTGNGFYRGSSEPLDDATYQIVAQAKGYNQIQATDSIPSKVLINRIDTLGVESQTNYKELRLTIEFDDVPNEANFYKIEVQTVQSISGSSYGYLLGLRSDDVSLGLSEDGYYSEVSFDDLLFDGNKKELVVYVEDTRDYDDYLEIRLTSLSKSAYLYDKTYKAYMQTNGNPFAQPVLMFNNVDDGFGILKAYQVVTKEVAF